MTDNIEQKELIVAIDLRGNLADWCAPEWFRVGTIRTNNANLLDSDFSKILDIGGEITFDSADHLALFKRILKTDPVIMVYSEFDIETPGTRAVMSWFIPPHLQDNGEIAELARS